MPLPSGCTSCVVTSVQDFDDLTNKPTICLITYIVNGITYSDSMNIGVGFLSDLTRFVAIRKKEQASLSQAQTIVANKIS